MKSFIPLSLFAIGAAAQGISVGYPAPGSKLKRGQNIPVQVIRYNSIQSATEIGIAIGFVSCNQNPCPPPESALGTVVYTGPFAPAYHGPGQQYQNFTVQVPPGLPAGRASVGVARFFLIGAGPSATIGGASVNVLVS